MTEPADLTQALSTMQSKSKKNGQKRSAKAEGDSGDKLSLSSKGGENHARPRGMDKDLPGVQLLKTLSLTQLLSFSPTQFKPSFHSTILPPKVIT